MSSKEFSSSGMSPDVCTFVLKVSKFDSAEKCIAPELYTFVSSKVLVFDILLSVQLESYFNFNILKIIYIRIWTLHFSSSLPDFFSSTTNILQITSMTLWELISKYYITSSMSFFISNMPHYLWHHDQLLHVVYDDAACSQLHYLAAMQQCRSISLSPLVVSYHILCIHTLKILLVTLADPLRYHASEYWQWTLSFDVWLEIFNWI